MCCAEVKRRDTTELKRSSSRSPVCCQKEPHQRDFFVYYWRKREFASILIWFNNPLTFCTFSKIYLPPPNPSSETQGQIVGTRESLNGRENVARRKAKNGSSRRSLLFFVPHFPARLDFPSSPLSAPGSPRMPQTHLSLRHNKRPLS